MVTVIQSFVLLGLEVHPIVCEVDLAAQLPSFSLVGLPSSVTQESRERVRSAVVNSGFEWPARKVTVNLLPADLPKWGSHFELAMALGVLSASNQERRWPPNVVALGELSLSGQVRPCGWLPTAARWLAATAPASRDLLGEPLALVAHEDDLRQLRQAAPDLGNFCELMDVRTLADAQRALNELSERTPASVLEKCFAHEWLKSGPDTAAVDIGDKLRTLSAVEGEPLATAAALVSIAGRHHTLLAGPFGAGKTMLVRAICEGARPLAPSRLSLRRALLSSFGESFQGGSPVVRLQASATRAAIEGSLLGTGQVLPGELTRAHCGILVADELLEYRRDVIEAFRQPLDDGVVRLQRAKFRTVLPASFQFLATTNLCPCGEYGGSGSACRCTDTRLQEYQRKLSGPVLDRFDIVVLVGRSRRSRRLKMEIPFDVAGLVEDLLQKDLWSERLENFSRRELQAEQDESDPAQLWSQVSCDTSPRGRLKIARVSRTIANLLGQARGPQHLRLAMVLRDELRRQLIPRASIKTRNNS